MTNTEQGQVERFKRTAREIEFGEDEARWDERLKNFAKGNDDD